MCLFWIFLIPQAILSPVVENYRFGSWVYGSGGILNPRKLPRDKIFLSSFSSFQCILTFVLWFLNADWQPDLNQISQNPSPDVRLPGRSTSTNSFHELIPPLQQFCFPFFGLFGLLNFQFPQNFPFLNVTGLTSWPSVGIFDPLQYSRWKSSWFSLCYIFISRHPVQPIYFLWFLNPEW